MKQIRLRAKNRKDPCRKNEPNAILHYFEHSKAPRVAMEELKAYDPSQVSNIPTKLVVGIVCEVGKKVCCQFFGNVVSEKKGICKEKCLTVGASSLSAVNNQKLLF